MGTDRHGQILEWLRTSERVSVAELAETLHASEVTIRRDLDALEDTGALRRVRGGAVSTLMRSDELPYAVRDSDAAAAKTRIGAAAAELLRDGESVILDSGTTGVAAARALTERRLTVMPLSIHALSVLADGPSITLLLAGGEVRPGELSLVGPVAERGITEFRFDTALLTCCGFSTTSGATAPDVRDAAVKRAAIASSARTIALADGAKFARTTLNLICDATDVDIVVTDTSAPDRDVDLLRDAGVEVLRA